MVKRVLAGILISVILMNGTLTANAQELPEGAGVEEEEQIQQIPDAEEVDSTEENGDLLLGVTSLESEEVNDSENSEDKETIPEDGEITEDELQENKETFAEDNISENSGIENENSNTEGEFNEEFWSESLHEDGQEETAGEFYASTRLSTQTFSTANLRSSGTINFKGNSGKTQVIIFGGIGSCGYTNEMLRYFDDLITDIDSNALNIYAFDIKGNTTDTILSAVSGKSDAIQVGEMNNSVYSLYQNYLGNVGIGSYTMPFVVYLNSGGDIYNYSTGMTSIKDICEKLMEGGVEVYRDIVLQEFHITGYTSYSYAYKVLELLNEERRKNGLTELQMDTELLEAAMQRAVECSFCFAHQRPNGERCFTASDRMSRENIAMGQTSPEEVMEGWINSSGHHANIMAADNVSVGIGCVCIGGKWYWTQCFGRNIAISAAQPKDLDRAYTVEADDNITAGLLTGSGKIKEGETIALSPIVISEYGRVFLDNDSYQWSSSKTNVAAVDKKGVISGKTAGTAVITGINIGNPAKTLTYTVTVEKKKVIEEEKMTGWQKISGIWYYYGTNGVKQTGWQKISSKWYYLNSNGEMQIGWCKVSGKWYYLDGSGVMQNGWQKIGGKWYYLDGSGVMQTGWQKISGKWYYLDRGGVMQTGWRKVGGKWYYLDGSGIMQTGWYKISSQWYYLDGSGVMQTGWLKLGSQWYYLNTDGVMVNSNTYINGKRNRFNSNGVWLGVG